MVKFDPLGDILSIVDAIRMKAQFATIHKKTPYRMSRNLHVGGYNDQINV